MLLQSVKMKNECNEKTTPTYITCRSLLEPLTYVVQPMDSAKARLQSLRSGLQNLIEPNFGLLDHLLSLSVISRCEMAEIRSKTSVYKCNTCLLDILAKKTEEHCLNLLLALERTMQTHINNYIYLNSVIGEEFGDDRPLDSLQLANLEINSRHLSELIDPTNGMLLELESVKCINWRYREHIEVKSTARERNEELLELMTRRSLADFHKLITVLNQSGQQFIAEALEKDAVVLPVEAVLVKAAVTESRDVERELTSKFRSFYCDRNRERTLLENCPEGHRHIVLDRMKEQFSLLRRLDDNIKLIGIKADTNLILYFLCRNYVALKLLKQFYLSGKVRVFLEDVFAHLLDCGDRVCIKTVIWRRDDYKKCVLHYKKIQKDDNSGSSKVVCTPVPAGKNLIDHLPSELLIIILMKVVLKMAQINKSILQSLVVVTVTSRVWWKMISRKNWFRQKPQKTH